VEITGLLDVCEVVLPERPWHSITISYTGGITGGELTPEVDHPYGEKKPRWFSVADLESIAYHPTQVVQKALKD
jgi:hypothetical protein